MRQLKYLSTCTLSRNSKVLLRHVHTKQHNKDESCTKYALILKQTKIQTDALHLPEVNTPHLQLGLHRLSSLN